MSTGRHAFKLNNATRLIKAVKAAGCAVRGVTMDGDVLTVLTDDAEHTVSERSETECSGAGASEWDERIKQNAAENAKRSA